MAEQTFQLQVSWHYTIARARGWRRFSLDVDADLVPTGQARQLIVVQVEINGFLTLNFSPSRGGDLTGTFEQSGSAEITVGSDTRLFSLAGADTTNPYRWQPTNSGDVTALYGALATETAGTVVLRDFVPVAPVFADDTGDPITGTVGQAIASVVVPAATGTPAPTYAAVGNLPAGVSFTAATRTLSFDENAIQAGSGTITIRATNSVGSDDWTVDYTFRNALKLGTQDVIGFRYGDLPVSAIYLGSTRIF